MNQSEINALQGTRLSEKAPWESYSEEMGSKLSPELEEAVKRYEERKHARTSSEALEELARQQELNSEIAKQYSWVPYTEYCDIEPRVGRIMHSTVLLDKLKNECGFKGWYAEHPMPGRYKLIYKREAFEPEYVCWVQAGFTTEFTIMKFDEKQIPLDERYRGWRTVLLQAIMKGVVKEEDILKAFGPATGPASVRYNSTLYEFRNRRVEII